MGARFAPGSFFYIGPVMNAHQRRKEVRTIWTEFRSMAETDKERTLAELTSELAKLHANKDRTASALFEADSNVDRLFDKNQDLTHTLNQTLRALKIATVALEQIDEGAEAAYIIADKALLGIRKALETD